MHPAPCSPVLYQSQRASGFHRIQQPLQVCIIQQFAGSHAHMGFLATVLSFQTSRTFLPFTTYKLFSLLFRWPLSTFKDFFE